MTLSDSRQTTQLTSGSEFEIDHYAAANKPQRRPNANAEEGSGDPRRLLRRSVISASSAVPSPPSDRVGVAHLLSPSVVCSIFALSNRRRGRAAGAVRIVPCLVLNLRHFTEPISRLGWTSSGSSPDRHLGTLKSRQTERDVDAPIRVMSWRILTRRATMPPYGNPNMAQRTSQFLAPRPCRNRYERSGLPFEPLVDVNGGGCCSNRIVSYCMSIGISKWRNLFPCHCLERGRLCRHIIIKWRRFYTKTIQRGSREAS